MKVLIVLVGLQGAGKTTAQKHASGATVLQPSTTRQKRGANDTEYDFVQHPWVLDDYMWTIDVGQEKYGMRKSELNRIDRVGMTVFHPAHLEVLKRSDVYQNFEVVTVGLDTIGSLDEQHARVNNVHSRKATQESFDREIAAVRSCDIVLKGSEVVVANALREVESMLGGRGGVLGKTAIQRLIAAGTLLEQADGSKIEAASYDLRLGDQYWCKGELITLDARSPIAKIPPYSYVVVQAIEEAAFPRFVAGNFDIRVKLFFEGVILSNGPQVDPGYRGALFCMLYNASGDEVGLNRGQHFATIQFQTLSLNSAGYADKYQGKKTFVEFVNGSDASRGGGRILEYIDGNFKSAKNTIYINLGLIWAIAAAAFTVLGIYTASASTATDRANAAIEKLNEAAAKAGETVSRAAEAAAKANDAAEKASSAALTAAEANGSQKSGLTTPP